MVNIYSKPASISLVDKLYVPPVELLGKALESKQKFYDQNMAESMALETLGSKINAIGYHRQLADGILNQYQSDLYKAVTDVKGDYSLITPQLLATKQKIYRDMGPNGTLGKINAYAKMYEEWDKTYKNDKVDQTLYSYFKNSIVAGTKDDANAYLSKGDFDIDMNRFEAIPENPQAAFKSVVDLADKYQITEGKSYSTPVQDPTTGRWIVQETDSKVRGGNDFATTIASLIQLDPTISKNIQLREKIKPGAGSAFGQSLVTQAYSILNRNQQVTKQDGFYAPEHAASKDKATGDFDPSTFFAGTYKGADVKSSALGTANKFSEMFTNKPLNTKEEVNNEIMGALTSAVGPGMWNSKQGLELKEKLGIMSAKASKMTTSQYRDYLKAQFYNEDQNFNYFSTFTDKNIIARQPDSKTSAALKAQILSGGDKQVVTDLQGKRFAIGDLDDNWIYSDSSLLAELDKGNAIPVYVPKLGGVGDNGYGIGIRHNGNIYFLGNKTKKDIEDYHQIREAKKNGYGLVPDPNRGNVFVQYDYNEDKLIPIETPTEAQNLESKYNLYGNTNALKALQSSYLYNQKK